MKEEDIQAIRNVLNKNQERFVEKYKDNPERPLDGNWVINLDGLLNGSQTGPMPEKFLALTFVLLNMYAKTKCDRLFYAENDACAFLQSLIYSSIVMYLSLYKDTDK